MGQLDTATAPSRSPSLTFFVEEGQRLKNSALDAGLPDSAPVVAHCTTQTEILVARRKMCSAKSAPTSVWNHEWVLWPRIMVWQCLASAYSRIVRAASLDSVG